MSAACRNIISAATGPRRRSDLGGCAGYERADIGYHSSIITCPHCQRTDQQVKVGRNASGSQRYLCKVCHRKYTPEPNSRGYPEALRRQAVQRYVDGMNFRRIARTLGVAHRSVINWVNAHAQRLPEQPPVPAGPLEVNEPDELFTFIGSKKQSLCCDPG
ncbi:MAG: IS1/IS1595 family N-terminal zinc-binding domain-containing protein [Aggregatilineaceae bacterium]